MFQKSVNKMLFIWWKEDKLRETKMSTESADSMNKMATNSAEQADNNKTERPKLKGSID